MGIPAKQFGGKGTTIQVGGLSTSSAKEIASPGTGEVFDANAERIVEIHNVGSNDCFFKIQIGSAASGTPAQGDGVGFIVAKGCTRPFILPANGFITASQKIIVVSLDTETATS